MLSTEAPADPCTGHPPRQERGARGEADRAPTEGDRQHGAKHPMKHKRERAKGIQVTAAGAPSEPALPPARPASPLASASSLPAPAALPLPL